MLQFLCKNLIFAKFLGTSDLQFVLAYLIITFDLLTLIMVTYAFSLLLNII